MKLSDVVSGAGLALYAEIALVIFVVVFALLALKVIFSRKSAMDAAARIPLEDEPVTPSRGGEGNAER